MKPKCALTKKVKKMLQSRRLQLGWSFTRMAKYFGIEVSTYRNWENGKTTYVQSDKQQRLVRSFILGDASQVSSDSTEVASAHDQESLDNCLALVSKIYTLLSSDSELLDDYSRALKGSLGEIMARYVEADSIPLAETPRG
ncbi:MAG: helix-turn-helix transcriptional regulator [Victivallales bacterium]|nr:helix-turn-helix transcriptional regulator [Victivallales bacterium]